jgi:flagellar hook-length control protein FliK
MIPDLFSGSLRPGSGHAPAPAGAWPTTAAGAPDPAAHPDAAAAGPFADLFADLLAATIAPQATSAGGNSGGNGTAQAVALPVSLTDLWIGLATPVYSEGGETTNAAEELDALTGQVDDDAALEASSLAPVPVTDAPDSAVPVPIIVQVPTDIMSAAPVAPRPEEAPVATSNPVARGIVPRQDDPSAREAAMTTSDTPLPQAASIAGDAKPRQADAAAGKNPSGEARQDAVDTAQPGSTERTLTPMERMESIGGDAPAPDAKTPAVPQPQQPGGRSVAPYDRSIATAPANGDARPVKGDVTSAAIDMPASNDKPAVATVTTIAGLPEGDAIAAEGNEASRQVGREGAPSSPLTTAGQPKAQPAPGQREHQSQGPVTPVTTPAPLDQAAQIAQQSVAARSFTPRQDEAAGNEDLPAVTERSAATAAVQGVASAAASQQQGGDAPQNGAGNQPSQDQAPRDVAASARTADLVTSSTPQAVTAAEPASRPVAQAAAPLATPFTPEQEVENAGRLIESMRVQYRQGVPEATVRLNPEHLGEVTISIRVDKGVVSATVHAETPAVQQWLEAQEEKLRSGLADQGLSLDRFTVRERHQQQERREQRPHQQARYRQPQEPGQRFEVTV